MIQQGWFLGEERVESWAVPLCRELGQQQLAPSPVLTPFSALDELQAISASIMDGRAEMSADDRKSLSSDLSQSLAHLGPSVTRVVNAILVPFQKHELSRAPGLFESVPGASRLLAAGRQLAEELTTGRAVAALWADVLAAFESGDSVATCELRSAQFREACERRGHGWAPLQRRLVGVLADRVIDIRVTEEADADLIGVDPREFAGRSWTERVELCARLAGSLPPEVPHVIWLAFGRADLGEGYLKRGPVQFFTHRLPLEAIRDGCPALNGPDFQCPPELSEPRALDVFDGLPKAPYVLARVDLGTTRTGNAEDRARDLVTSLLDVAAPTSNWTLLDGVAGWAAGSWWSASFQEPDLVSRLHLRDVNPIDEGTGGALHNLGDQLADKLVEGNEQIRAAVAERRWQQTVSAAKDPAQRLALSMRSLERGLPLERGVFEAASHYLRDDWSFGRLSEALFQAAYQALHSSELEIDDRTALRAEILPATGRLGFTFRRNAFYARMDDIRHGLPEPSLQRRLLDEVARTVSTPAEALSALERFDAQFDRLLRRGIRQRNAVLHGAPAIPAVVATCEPFIVELSRHVVMQGVYAALSDDEPLLTALERARAAWLRQRHALRVGKDPKTVLFAGDLQEQADHQVATADQTARADPER